jgi:hypothetical protein
MFNFFKLNFLLISRILIWFCQNYTKVYLIPVRLTIIKKTNNNKCCWRCRKKRTLIHCWWECKQLQPLWKLLWRFLKKLEFLVLDLPYDPILPVLGIYPKEYKSVYKRKTCIPRFIEYCSQSKLQNQTRFSMTDEGIKEI